LHHYATPEEVQKLFRKVRDRSLVAAMLGLAVADVDDCLSRVSTLPNDAAYTMPDRENAWSQRDLHILGQRWSCGAAVREIARLLGRSPRSVSTKRRTLGLPRRTRIKACVAAAIFAEKRSAIPEDKKTILTHEQASLLTMEQRRGRTWYIRNNLEKLTMTAHKRANRVRWYEKAHVAMAWRHFAFQSPAEIMADFLITENSLKSNASWEQLPAQRGKKHSFFIPADAEIYVQDKDYIRRECLSKRGCFFWTDRVGGDRVSRRYRRSMAAVHGIAA